MKNQITMYQNETIDSVQQTPDVFDRKALRHPCPFNEEVCSIFINRFTDPGEMIMDPFLGSGTTLLSCLANKRHGIGIELMNNFVELSFERITERSDILSVSQAGGSSCLITPASAFLILNADSKLVLANMPNDMVDFIYTSPPYYGVLQQVGERAHRRMDAGLPVKYGESLEEEFWREMKQVYEYCHRVLKIHRYMIIVIHDYYYKNDFFDHPGDTVQVVKSCGFKLVGKQIFVDEYKRQPKYRMKVQHGCKNWPLNMIHYYALIFEKQ